jgi:predicted dehydrogenase
MTEILARQKAKSGAIPSGMTTAFSYESCYLREIRHFLDAVEGKQPYAMTNVAEELQNVRTFHAVVRSSEDRREVAIETRIPAVDQR